MKLDSLKRTSASFWLALSTLTLPAMVGGQSPLAAPTASLSFSVSDGNCLPASVTSPAGRTAIVVKMTSANPQHVALSTRGTDKKFLFEHAQVGSSERWTAIIYIPVGSYELMSSLNGSKCVLTVTKNNE
jgi:hypothetical protein